MEIDVYFFTNADSITSLLKQLSLIAPKYVSRDNIHGATEENAIEIKEENEMKEAQSNVANEDELVGKKTKQFAKGVNKE